MSQRHHIALVAAAATLLAALPIGSIFATWTWLFLVAVTVAAICGTAMAVRAARGPVWAQLGAMLLALLISLTWLFPSGAELGRLIPTPATLSHFASLLSSSGTEIQEEAVPVPNTDGILLLTTLGIGLVAILVDLFAVGLRKPALAGLPMLAIYSVPVAVLPEGLSIIPFAFAAAGYLWLLVTDSVDRVRRFGRRFTGEGRDVDLWEPSPLASAGRRLGVVGVAVAMMLPLAVPWTSGILDRLMSNNGGGTGPGPGGDGRPAQVDLFALLNSSLNRDKAFEMARVSTNEVSPYYLRIGVADQVAADGFRNRTPVGGDPISDGLPAFVGPQIAGVRSEQHHASVEIVDFESQLAPVYQQTTSLRGLDNAWSYDPFTNQIWSRRASISGKSFEFDYVRTTYTENALRQAGGFDDIDPQLKALTYVPPVRQVEQTVADLTEGKDTEYDKVRALYNFFSPDNQFKYTLKPKVGTSGNAIVDFLAGREGFCVQYAAALAWLVRAAGYPARVAIGFTKGSSVDANTFAMTNFNLHAWTEVYFPNIGWVPFDATPPSSVIGSSPSVWAPNLAEPLPTGQDLPGDKPSAGPPVTGGSAEPRPDPGEGDIPIIGAFTGATGRWTLIGLGIVVVLGLLLMLPAARRSSLRRSRRPRSNPTVVIGSGDGLPRLGAYILVLDAADIPAARRDAHAAWAELLDTMIDYDITLDPAETPRATADRLGTLTALTATTLPASAAALPATASGDADLLASAEERARYARTPLRADPLDAAVRGMRNTLRARATRRERLVATFLPRSVVQRWRLGWVTFVGRMVATTGARRDRVVRALSPRRLVTGRSK